MKALVLPYILPTRRIRKKAQTDKDTGQDQNWLQVWLQHFRLRPEPDSGKIEQKIRKSATSRNQVFDEGGGVMTSPLSLPNRRITSVSTRDCQPDESDVSASQHFENRDVGIYGTPHAEEVVKQRLSTTGGEPLGISRE
jgi:hypothetical protein